MRITRILIGISWLAAMAAGCSSDESPTGPDTTPPTIAWTTPQVAGDTLFVFETDSVAVAFAAADPDGEVAAVEVYLDGVLALTLTTPPFAGYLDLVTVGVNRSARVFARARDAGGNVAAAKDTLRFVYSPPPDTATWTQLQPARRPAPRDRHSLTLDAAGRQALLFGGFSYTTFAFANDVWSFDLDTDTWDSMATTGVPSPRGRHASSVVNGQLLIMGGGEGDFPPDTLLQDYALLDVGANTWSVAFLPDLPVNNLDAVAIGDRVFAYGGQLPGQTATNRMWVYDASAGQWSWTVGHPPGVRVNAAMVGDLEGGRLFLYGGRSGVGNILPSDASNYRASVPGLSWRSTLAPGPPPITETAMVYDSVSNRVLLWGGRDAQGGFPTEVWEFSLGALRWRQVPTSGGGPSGRCSHRMIMDVPNSRLIMFGGAVTGLGTAETWELRW